MLRVELFAGSSGIGLKSGNLGVFRSVSTAVSLTSGSLNCLKSSHRKHCFCPVTEVSDIVVERYCSYLQDT